MYKYDTVHGRCGQTVTHDKDAKTLSIDGKPIKIFGEMVSQISLATWYIKINISHIITTYMNTKIYNPLIL